MADYISPRPNDPFLEAMIQKPVDAFTAVGAMETGGMKELQNAIQARQQEQMTLNEMASQLVQQPQAQAQQQAPASYTRGLMPALVEGPTYQARPMPGEAQEQPPQQRVPLNQMARAYLEQGVRAKGLYDEAERAGNTEAMALAHAGGEQARTALRQLGVDPAAYGMEGSYAEAQQALAANDMQAMQNIISGDMSKSSIANYDDTYNYLINQGYSREIAAEVAGQKARSYAVQRTQELENAFNMYGHDGKVINPMGVQILQKLAEEEPDMATYYVQRYAGPLQEYAANRQERNMAIQQANKEKNAAVQFDRDLKKMGVQAQYKALLQQNEAAQKEAQAQRDYGRKVALEVEKARIKVQYGLVKGKGKSGSSSGSSDDGGFKPTEALSVIEKYNKWNSDNPDKEWQNPLTDAYDEALATLNRQSPTPHDINNADSVYSWAQSVLEYNARNGYPATPEGLYQAIAAVGGYGPAVAEDLKNDPNKPLEKYGRTN